MKVEVFFMSKIHVFKTGEHKAANGTSFTATKETLAELASSYNPQNFMAPAVKGHPKHDDPAYGWVNKVIADGDDLYVEFEENSLDKTFQEEVKNGRYKNISISIYPPKHPSNPCPGKASLRHVGFLGAMAPAVKGLKPVNFADEEDGIWEFSVMPQTKRIGFALRRISSIFRRIREREIEENGIEAADSLVRDWEIESIDEWSHEDEQTHFSEPDDTLPTEKNKDDEKMSKEIEEKQAALDAERKAFEAEKAEIEKQKQEFNEAQAKQKAEALINSAIEEKKLTKGQAEGLAEFMVGLNDDELLEFGEAGKKSSFAFMADFIGGLPQVASFSEYTALSGDEIDFSENESAILLKRAKQLEIAEGLAFTEALDKADVELKAAKKRG